MRAAQPAAAPGCTLHGTDRDAARDSATYWATYCVTVNW